MPELPEVQTLINDLKASKLCGCTIQHAVVNWPRIIDRPDLKDFKRQIAGKRIQDIRRRGKYIIFKLSARSYLLIHLRMTGKLYLRPHQKSSQKHEHVIFNMDSGVELVYHDSRKFGRFFLVDHPDQVISKLGPEPLSSGFSSVKFHQIIKTRKRMIKPMLLDQSVIAGLGNIYADEALWLAGIHPQTNTEALDEKQVKQLYKAIRMVLNKGIKNLGTTLGSGITNFYSVSGRKGNNKEALNVFRRTGQACPKCHTKIVRLMVAQRSSHVCLTCQKLK